MKALPVTDKNFATEVLQSDQNVLVDFWAPWCGPCRMMGGVVDEVAGELEGQAKVVKVNIDESPETAAAYGIQSIPSFAVFENGQVKARSAGVVPKQALHDLLAATAG